MRSQDFVVAPETGAVGDAIRALIDAAGDVNWHVIVAYADHYGAIQAGKLAQSVIGRGAQAALQVPLRDLNIPAVNAMAESERVDPDSIRRLTLVVKDNRPSAMIYEPMRGSFMDQMNAKSAFDQLVAAASAQGAAAAPSHDFIVMPETRTVGDAIRALKTAKGNENWYVIVRYADHYGAIQAGKLAQAALGQGAQAALETPLRSWDVPRVNAVPQGKLSAPAEICQLTLALENNLPVTLYLPASPAEKGGVAAPSLPTTPPSVATTPSGKFTDEARADLYKKLTAHFDIDDLKTLSYDLMVDQPPSDKGNMAGILITRVESMGRATELIKACQQWRPEVFGQPSPVEPSVPTPSPQTALERLTDMAFVRHAVAYDASAVPTPTVETTDARARYVNTWLTDRPGGEAFMRERSLARKRRYFVQLHIGPRLKESIILAPRPIDPDLPPIPDEGLLLRVKLFSRDFKIEQDTAELRLFREGATDRLHFAITAPDKTGEARLRAGIYYQNNLVQSILVYAQIDDQEMKRGRGDYANWAEMEYSLSEDWADVTQLRPRRVSVFVNDSPDGTHTVGVVGTQTEGTLDIGRDKMKEAVTEFRARLLGIIMDDQKRYRYGPDNSGSQDKFIDDLKTLAYLGTNLFQSVFWQEGTIDFTQTLREALAGPQPAVIQVARLSPDFVFPWAGVYDRRLLIDRSKNQVCLEPLKRDTPQAALQACCECSHSNDTNTICLSGFWGFRHVVEQPVSVIKNGKPTSVVREIKASGKPQASMNVYVGADFKLRAAHQDWIAVQIKNKGGDLILSDDLSEVQRSLPQPQQLCYFYCHGGSSPDSVNPWLTVGADGRLMPPDLYGLGLDEAWRFKNVRPLVFINACHSIEFTPEALSAFLPNFATAGASGVIGTEVSIFEPLAVEFGQGLIQAFLAGEPVGQAVQRLRWQLLLKRNVLGLVYTPYCYADLRLVLP